mgnify:CR=1 FL=1
MFTDGQNDRRVDSQTDTGQKVIRKAYFVFSSGELKKTPQNIQQTRDFIKIIVVNLVQ